MKLPLLFLVYMVNFPLRADRGTTAFSPVIYETAKLATFMPGSKWGMGFVIAIVRLMYCLLLPVAIYGRGMSSAWLDSRRCLRCLAAFAMIVRLCAACLLVALGWFGWRD